MFDIIVSYTREDALNDGVLIDITEIAKYNGFKIPVAITSGVQNELNNIPDAYSYQSYEGRLHDLLQMAYFNAITNKESWRSMFKFIMPTVQGEEIKKKISMVLEVHGGDNGEPVVTIMLPHED